MKLLTKQDLKNLPVLYAQEKVADPIVDVKVFLPGTIWTWYATEYNPEEQVFFGWVEGQEKELGYFSLRDLQSAKGFMGLPVERDMHFDPKPLSWVKAGRHYDKYDMTKKRPVTGRKRFTISRSSKSKGSSSGIVTGLGGAR
jgi:hypothetical protein